MTEKKEMTEMEAIEANSVARRVRR